MKKLRKLLGALVVACAMAAAAEEIILDPPLPADYCDKNAIYAVWGWYWSWVYMARGCGWPT